MKRGMYSVAELSRLARMPHNPRSAARMGRQLKNAGVTIHVSGGGRVHQVFLSDLRRYVPDLCDTIEGFEREDQEKTDGEDREKLANSKGLGWR